MFDSLQAPPDLATARVRLRAAIADVLDRGPEVDTPADTGQGGDAPWSVWYLPSPDGDWPGEPDGPAAVVVADSVLWRADPARLRRLADAVGRRSVLLFLEPTADVGWRRVLHRFGRPLWRWRAGHDFDTDVPAALRAAGLHLTDLNRFVVGAAGIRTYAIGRAEHIG